MTATTLQFLALTFAGSAAVASQFVPASLCDEDEAISILGAVAIGAVLLMVGKVAV